jgi:NitT/TauT family transport system substrate-binding protein
VHEGSELIDPIKSVRSGVAHFGVASADRVLRENEAGADLVIIGSATFRSPVVYLTKPGRNIQGPKDFLKRTVGIQPGTNTELILLALLDSQRISPKDIKIVDSGWGTEMFELGTLDVLGAFAYDEPIALRLKNRPIERLIAPEDYGVRFVGTVYFTRKRLVASRPREVQAFMNALFSGWKNALSNPDEAMNILEAKYIEVRNNSNKERQSFLAGREYFAGEGGSVLSTSKERWTDMGKTLVKLGKLRQFDFNASIDYRFLEKARTR